MHLALHQQSSGLSPAIVAALIAVPVGLLTVVVQWLGIRRGSGDTNRQLEQQGKHLERTLAEQRDQLDRTIAEDRSRTLNERFATAADRLGTDRPAPVRLAAVHAMAGLADDWPENRQTCVEVLCAYLRMPYSPDPGPEATEGDRLAFRAAREVRHTVIRVIRDHLQPAAIVSWAGLDLDFTGVVFDAGDFTGSQFSVGRVSFRSATFADGWTNFNDVVFSAGQVSFDFAKFSSGRASFDRTKFSGASVTFEDAELLDGRASFSGAETSGSFVGFRSAQFSGGEVLFDDANFSAGLVRFDGAQFVAGKVGFGSAQFSGARVRFSHVQFAGAEVSFDHAKFSGGLVRFDRADFSGGSVRFGFTKFSAGRVAFGAAKFTACEVSFPGADFCGALVGFDGAEFSRGSVSLTPRTSTTEASASLERGSMGASSTSAGRRLGHGRLSSTIAPRPLALRCRTAKGLACSVRPVKTKVLRDTGRDMNKL